MSEYLDEAVWREEYCHLVCGVRAIREAIEESFGTIAPLPKPANIASIVEECSHIALAIVVYAGNMKRRVAELEEQIALTSRLQIEGVTETEDVRPVTSEQGPAEYVGTQKRSAYE